MDSPRSGHEEIIEGVREFCRIRNRNIETGFSSREYLRALRTEWITDLKDEAEGLLREYNSNLQC
ncbi:hypothetical protein [Vulcanisaeta sp. JCM 16159]|uniref:hypothetical protein n=1 Tax=Vulcanisaeta sp. JCM 16159 TaxID=1295371 RepID=UPI000B1FA50A|nr:hypothetical protein [Vulcanisaeta sp. JCM 16159]